ncbi:hypothetical protein M8J75_001969 [Diaphorina citri]|nr:hypothetical protein M8J75_001969 [Diaphorina citri]
MVYPQPLKKLCFYLEFIGYVNFNRFQKPWQNKCMTIYCNTMHILGLIAIASHLISTITRARRYMPEFFQRLFEDLGFNLYYMECLIFKWNYERLNNLMTCMENKFSTVNSNVVRECQRKEKCIFYGFLVLAACTMGATMIEACLPLSQKELDILAFVYQRKNPERKLPSNFWIPYIDDSVSWYYEILFLCQFYMGYLIVIMATVTMTTIPLIVTHLEGQYIILCQNIMDISRPGPNDYVINKLEKNKPNKLKRLRQIVTQRKLYQQRYCRLLVQFHQKLLRFQDEMYQFYSPNMFIKIFINNLMFALCLYQLVLSSTSMSNARRYKMFAQFMAIGSQYFYLCICSETLDDCNTKIERAIGNTL